MSQAAQRIRTLFVALLATAAPAAVSGATVHLEVEVRLSGHPLPLAIVTVDPEAPAGGDAVRAVAGLDGRAMVDVLAGRVQVSARRTVLDHRREELPLRARPVDHGARPGSAHVVVELDEAWRDGAWRRLAPAEAQALSRGVYLPAPGAARRLEALVAELVAAPDAEARGAALDRNGDLASLGGGRELTWLLQAESFRRELAHDPAGAAAAAEAASDVAARSGAVDLRADTLLRVAQARLAAGAGAGALEAAEAAVALLDAREPGARATVGPLSLARSGAFARTVRARVVGQAGEPAAAVRAAAEASAAAASLDRPWLEADALSVEGSALGRLGDGPGAARAFEEAARRYGAADRPEDQAWCLVVAAVREPAASAARWTAALEASLRVPTRGARRRLHGAFAPLLEQRFAKTAPAPGDEAERRLAAAVRAAARASGSPALAAHGCALPFPEGCDAPAPDPSGETPLHWAARNGLDGVVARLLGLGALVDARDARGRTALALAARGGHRDVMLRLLRAGAAADAVDEDGLGAVAVAAVAGWEDLLALALERGAAVDRRNAQGATPLMLAARIGNAQIVSALLDHGADPRAESSGFTALHAAVLESSSRLPVIRQLLAAGADPDAPLRGSSGRPASAWGDGVTPLMAAVTIGRVEPVVALLEAGADPGRRTSAGLSAADLARLLGQTHLLPLLSPDPEARRAARAADPARLFRRRVLEALRWWREAGGPAFQPFRARLREDLAAMPDGEHSPIEHQLSASLRAAAADAREALGESSPEWVLHGRSAAAIVRTLDPYAGWDEETAGAAATPLRSSLDGALAARCETMDEDALLDTLAGAVFELAGQPSAEFGPAFATCLRGAVRRGSPEAFLVVHLAALAAERAGEHTSAVQQLEALASTERLVRGGAGPGVLLAWAQAARVRVEHGEDLDQAEAALELALSATAEEDLEGGGPAELSQLGYAAPRRLAERWLAAARPADAERVLRRQLSLAGSGSQVENLVPALLARGDWRAAIALDLSREHELGTGLARTQAEGGREANVNRHVFYYPMRDRILGAATTLAGGDPLAARLALEFVLSAKGRAERALVEVGRQRQARRDPGARAARERLEAVRRVVAEYDVVANSSGYDWKDPAAAQDAAAGALLELSVLEKALAEDLPSEQLPPPTLEALQRALPPDGALVELAVFHGVLGAGRALDRGPRYAALVLRPAGPVRAVALSSSARDVDAAVLALLEALRSAAADPGPPARALHDLVFAPLAPLLGDARRIYVAADGPLHLVPFAALVDAGGQPLLERYTFTMLGSGAELVRAGAAPEPREPALVVGALDYGAGLPWEQLPATAAEVREVAAALPGAKVLEGGQGTETALKRVQGPLVLHLATHGFFEPPQGNVVGPMAGSEREDDDLQLLRSGVVLAGANTLASGDDDGTLTALEAAGLDLRGTRLVTLSACQTGVGNSEEGNGVLGLRRALAVAGAESQIVSLWPVDDRATRQLMADLYRRLGEGAGRADALRAAQLALLHSGEGALAPAGERGMKRHGAEERPQGGSSWRHPYYWASFILSGQDGPLDRAPLRPRPPPLALLRAAARGDAALARRLLAQGADPGERDPATQRTPLLAAARAGHLAVVEALLAAGASPLVEDRHGMGPLAWAAYEGNAPLVRTLLEHGADPLQEPWFGASPAAIARWRGHEAVAEALDVLHLGRGAHRPQPLSPKALDGAVARCDADAVRLALLRTGPDALAPRRAALARNAAACKEGEVGRLLGR